jgi:hypothetical protein
MASNLVGREPAVPRRGNRTEPRVLTLGFDIYSRRPESGARKRFARVYDGPTRVNHIDLAPLSGHVIQKYLNQGLKPLAQSYYPFGVLQALAPPKDGARPS